MTEFKKRLNKLLKEEAFAEIVDDCNSYRMLFKEAIRAIVDRMELEEDVFWAVKNDEFAMGDMTDEDLRKKIKGSKTLELQQYVELKRGDKS